MRRILVLGAVGFALALPVVAGIGYVIDGAAGCWGALLGLAVPVAFFSITAVVALVTARTRPELLGFAVLGSWLAKVLLLIGVLAWLSRSDFYNRAVFFVVLLLGTFAYLIAEAFIVLRSRQPYVEPSG